MKEICLIELQPYPTTIGGGITHLIELSKELVNKGHKVTIISSKPKNKFKNPVKGTNLIHITPQHKKLEDFRGFKKIFYLFWRAYFELNFIFRVSKILRNKSYDILAPQSPVTPSLACVLARKDFFITAHGVHHKGFEKLYQEKKDKLTSKLGGLLYKKIEHFTVKKAKKIICLGKDSYEYYSKFKKCTIIPNGIDTEVFYPSKRKIKKTIISVGRFTEQKQVDKLIIAMDKLQDYELQIIGLGPLEKQIKQMCKGRKNCKFLGYKNQKQIAGFLRKAEFTVLPSLFEGLPISMLEAMACGVIPVTTKVGDIPLIVKEGKTGFFLKNNSPEEIVRAVRETEKNDLDKVSRACVETIKKDYDWDKIAERYLKTWQAF